LFSSRQLSTSRLSVRSRLYQLWMRKVLQQRAGATAGEEAQTKVAQERRKLLILRAIFDDCGYWNCSFNTSEAPASRPFFTGILPRYTEAMGRRMAVCSYHGVIRFHPDKPNKISAFSCLPFVGEYRTFLSTPVVDHGGLFELVVGF
jgi:hypothetical protein